MVKIGFVIPFFNGQSFIIPLINSINNSELFNIKKLIFIIDNSLNLNLNDKELDNVIHIKTNYKIGFGRACNIGKELAIVYKCDYVLFCNQDILLNPNTLDELLKPHKLFSNKNIITFPVPYNYSGENLDKIFIKWVLKENNFEDKFYKNNKNYFEVKNIGAACFFISIESLITIDLFDPIFFMYGEDNEFFERYLKKNGKLILCKKSIIKHYHNSINDKDINIVIMKRNSNICLKLLDEKFSLKYFIKDILISYKEAVVCKSIYILITYIIHDLRIVFIFLFMRNQDERIDYYLKKDYEITNNFNNNTHL